MAIIPEPEMNDIEALGLASRINDLLAKMGYADGDGTEWWLHQTHKRLHGLTAMQAWSRGRRQEVFALVEAYVSERYAEALSANPKVVEHLLDKPAP